MESRELSPPITAVKSEWKPIETAPTDGTWFLAYRPSPQDAGSWNTLVAVAWNDDAKDFVWPDDAYDPYSPPDLGAKDEDGWFITDVFEGRGSFTHWMPLMAPPSSAKPADRASSRDRAQ